MKALWYEQFGDADKVLTVGDIPTPEPQQGEVLIQITRSSINPSDVKMRQGARAGNAEMPFPNIIPHSDGAGVITKVGPGVNASRIGERVWIANGQWQRAHGTAAEFIALDERLAFTLPDNVHDDIGAAIGIPLLTAYHSVYSAGDIRGKSVLVSGAAGTVGKLAVQLARIGGATVFATSSPRDFDAVKAAGATHVFDYRDPQLAERISSASGDGIERIVEVEFGQNLETNTQIIANNGHIVTFGSMQQTQPELSFYPLMFKSVNVHFFLVYLLQHEQRQAYAKEIFNLLKDEALDIPIHAHFSLDDAVAAHQSVETGRKGAVLLDVQ